MNTPHTSSTDEYLRQIQKEFNFSSWEKKKLEFLRLYLQWKTKKQIINILKISEYDWNDFLEDEGFAASLVSLTSKTSISLANKRKTTIDFIKWQIEQVETKNPKFKWWKKTYTHAMLMSELGISLQEYNFLLDQVKRDLDSDQHDLSEDEKIPKMKTWRPKKQQLVNVPLKFILANEGFSTQTFDEKQLLSLIEDWKLSINQACIRLGINPSIIEDYCNKKPEFRVELKTALTNAKNNNAPEDWEDDRKIPDEIISKLESEDFFHSLSLWNKVKWVCFILCIPFVFFELYYKTNEDFRKKVDSFKPKSC